MEFVNVARILSPENLIAYENIAEKHNKQCYFGCRCYHTAMILSYCSVADDVITFVGISTSSTSIQR